jgi:outer membrane protein assembly factor BamB
VANGLVYVGSNDHNLYALNTATGAKEWSYTGSGGADLASPVVANGMVYINISNDNDLYAFSLPGATPAVRRPNPRQLHPNYGLRPQNGKRS